MLNASGDVVSQGMEKRTSLRSNEESSSSSEEEPQKVMSENSGEVAAQIASAENNST